MQLTENCPPLLARGANIAIALMIWTMTAAAKPERQLSTDELIASAIIVGIFGFVAMLQNDRSSGGTGGDGGDACGGGCGGGD